MKKLLPIVAGFVALLTASALASLPQRALVAAPCACQELLAHLSIEAVEDVHGNPHPTLVIRGLNVQIVSGDDIPASPLQLGNLIVGYANAPTGSHNVIASSDAHVDNSHGCVVSGGQALLRDSTDSVILTGAGAILGGHGNVVIGGSGNGIGNPGGDPVDWSVVIGGDGNRVCAGRQNTIVGGQRNGIQSPGFGNVIVGGSSNLIAEEPALCSSAMGLFHACSIFGGDSNRVHAPQGSVAGATIGGGQYRDVTGDHDWRAGDLFQDD